ncbi:hypothetical protein MKW98_002970 [Papaver atlanticum]|uniref:Uncharacterized protein n=1 Tax=Papaver atlanticum TaxID=357466 RepID=A0AAD4XXZ6_9MAGN|nr:hypothetical protein MKW98_002970 [Papaver atlanticum]
MMHKEVIKCSLVEIRAQLNSSTSRCHGFLPSTTPVAGCLISNVLLRLFISKTKDHSVCVDFCHFGSVLASKIATSTKHCGSWLSPFLLLHPQN